MHAKFRVLLCELHEESNTFNPLLADLDSFRAIRCAEGQEAYRICKELPCAMHGMIDAVEAGGGEVVPLISLDGHSGGCITDRVLKLFLSKVEEGIKTVGVGDGIFVSLHGATCSESHSDVCGLILGKLRELVGEKPVIAASFDLHANITETILRSADIVCGYQSYPHVDFYQTGYRAATLGIRKMQGKPTYCASTIIPMMVPPVGYTSQLPPFSKVIAYGESLVSSHALLDFTTFQVQPWLDISPLGSAVVAIAETPEAAKLYAEKLAVQLYENRDGYWPELMTIDEVIDRAEANTTGKPIILVDSADSPNGGAVGDSVAPALRVIARGSKIHMGMFVKDPEAAKKAFEAGVGNTAEFSIGAKYTPGMPGPLVSSARVRSLHDGAFVQEGPAGKGFSNNIGKTAVLSIGNIDIMVCEMPSASGDPQILRHFGIEPKLYDMIVVKANTSFRVPYSAVADEFCYADTPGAGSASLKSFVWNHIPHPFYPFDLSEDYQIEKPVIRRA